MRQIRVVRKHRWTGVMYALVDDDMYYSLNIHTWQPAIRIHTIYAQAYINGKTKFMHNLVLPNEDKNLTVDHINGNGLDNQRSNLRLATRTQQLGNRSINQNDKSSKYKGVYYDKQTGKWEACIHRNNIKYKLGRFITEEIAAKAYNKAAIEYFGEFAKLNIIEE